MQEMKDRGYKPNPVWSDMCYRGKSIGYDFTVTTSKKINTPIYPEHNQEYLEECLENLKKKGIDINV